MFFFLDNCALLETGCNLRDFPIIRSTFVNDGRFGIPPFLQARKAPGPTVLLRARGVKFSANRPSRTRLVHENIRSGARGRRRRVDKSILSAPPPKGIQSYWGGRHNAGRARSLPVRWTEGRVKGECYGGKRPGSRRFNNALYKSAS